MFQSRSWVTMSKLFFAPGRSPRLPRSAAVTSSTASSTVTPVYGFTIRLLPRIHRFMCRRPVSIGMMPLGESPQPADVGVPIGLAV